MSAVDHEVVVIGAGAAGLVAGAELRRLGVDVVLLERRPAHATGSRAIGLHAPSLAALEPSGVTDRILERCARITGGVARSHGRTLGQVRFDRRPGRYPFIASVPQEVSEAALRAAAPTPRLGVAVQALSPRDDHVAVTLAHPDGRHSELRAGAVVIATGAAGRELALPWAGARARHYPDRYLMADIADAPDQPPDAAVIHLDREGVVESFPLPGGGRRFVAWDGRTSHERVALPAPERLRRAVATRAASPQSADSIEAASAFSVRRVLLGRMRAGRVFVIGDAAHEVSPIGGQGMNLGILDAASLAPLLAAGLDRDGAPDALDRWEAMRLSSAHRAARLAGANTALGRARAPASHAALAVLIRSGLATPLSRLAAHAYSMGFDRSATSAR